MQQKSELTSLSDVECRELAVVLNRKYGTYLGDRSFEVSVTNDDAGVFVKVLLRNPDGSFYYPVETRMNHAKAKISRHEAAMLLLDYTDTYFEEYFQDGEDVFVPIDWAEHECDGVPFEIKGQVINLKLETMADDLLRSKDKGDKPDDA